MRPPRILLAAVAPRRILRLLLGGLLVVAGSRGTASATTLRAQTVSQTPPTESPTPARPAPATSKPAATAREREDERARAAFARLTPALRAEFVAYLELETHGLGTFQLSLVTWIAREQPLDPRTLEPWPATTWFDPKEHAPAQPIERSWLEPDARAAVAARQTLVERWPARTLRPSVRYDDASGRILRVPVDDEPLRVFENALAGAPPGADVAEALLERALDDDSQRATAAAFAHAYTDRSGHAYPGVTLYDAWASGAEIEMPDVDTLGILHALLPERREFVAPVPGPQQAPLYDLIGARFTDLHRVRSLRRALVATWLFANEPLRDGFEAARDNLHALWEDCASTPATMAARLPKPAERAAFLEAWAARCHAPDGPYEAGVRRRATLERDSAAVRSAVFRGLEEFGVLPPPSPAPHPPPTPAK